MNLDKSFLLLFTSTLRSFNPIVERTNRIGKMNAKQYEMNKKYFDSRLI
jgi:hypothetical protein